LVGVARNPKQNHPLSFSLINFSNVKRIIWLTAIVLGGLLLFSGAGCKKNQIAQPKTPEEALLALRQSLVTAPREVQEILYGTVDNGIRYGKTQDAIAGLEKIAADPSLKEDQKKLATDVANMLRAKASNP
jgi:hypothetical protein